MGSKNSSMFLPFFLELKAARVPVSLREYLTLLEAHGSRRWSQYDVEGFYYLARAALVKDERHIDRFDQVFAHVFKGVEAVSGEAPVDVANIPEEWLRRLAEKHLTEEEKKLVEALGGFDKADGDAEEAAGGAEGPPPGRHRNGSAPPAPRPSAPMATIPKACASASMKAATAAR